MEFANEIKAVRQKAFLTQEAFAKELGVAFSTVNRWETEKRHPSVNAMKRISRFCDKHGISFDELQKAWLSRGQE